MAEADPIDGSLEDLPRCAGCGYDLRSLPEPRCPECGLVFDPKDLTAEVPWLFRSQLGWRDGFRNTVALVLLHPGRLAEQVQRNIYVEPSGPPRFRIICVAIGALALASMLATAQYDRRPGWRWFAIAWASSLLPAAVLLYLASVPIDLTGFTSAAAEVRCRRLYHFTAAAMVLLPFMCVIHAVSRVVWGSEAAVPVGLLLLAGFTSIWKVNSLWFQLRATHRDAAWAAGNLLITLGWLALLGWFCYVVAMIIATGLTALAPN